MKQIKVLITKTASIIAIISLMLVVFSGCSATEVAGEVVNELVDSTIQNDIHHLSSPIVHEIYDYTGKPGELEVISICNSMGDITVSQSVDENFHVSVILVQTKEIKDLDKKLDNLKIEPLDIGNILFMEPLTSDLTQNYWEWIDQKLNANGIQVDFELQIPDSIKELRLIGGLGNIDLNDITARIYANTEIGNITGENITPLDNITCITSLSKNVDSPININFASIDYANEVAIGFDLGSVNIGIPKNSEYIYEIGSERELEYENTGSFFENAKCCREFCVSEFVPIKSKTGTTVIETLNDVEEFIQKVNIIEID